VEDLRRDLGSRDAELLVELTLSSTLYTHDGSLELSTGLSGDAQRVRAAGIGPHAWKKASQHLDRPQVAGDEGGAYRGR